MMYIAYDAHSAPYAVHWVAECFEENDQEPHFSELLPFVSREQKFWKRHIEIAWSF